MVSQFGRIFVWHALRDLRQRWLLALLNIASIALGIAVFLAIQLANSGANRAFAASVDLVAGKADLEVRGEIDEKLWPAIARLPGVAAATATVEGIVMLPGHPGEYLRLIGIDLFSGAPFATYVTDTTGANLEKWVGTPGGIALPRSAAERLGVSAGSVLPAFVNGAERQLTVLSTLASASPAAGQERFAAMDIGQAQEFFGKQGTLTAIQILASDPAGIPALVASIDRLLPPGLHAVPPREHSQQMRNMVSSFQLNLTALSMVSLLVGVFLIYNSIAATVARRRLDIGILRALGAERWQIRALFLAEACVLGGAGILAGTALSIGLAGLLAGAMSRTISSLYILTRIGEVALTPGLFLAATVCGFGAVLAGAWQPAAQASRIDPVAALSRGEPMDAHLAAIPSRGRLSLFFALAAALCSVAALYSAPWLGFAGAFFILMAAAAASPAALAWFSAAMLRLFATSRVEFRLAASQLQRAAHRHSITLAALAAAIAMTSSLTIMIHSFRETLGDWIEQGIVADLFISPASNEIAANSAEIPPTAAAWLLNRPEVDSVDAIRGEEAAFRLNRDGPEKTTRLLAIDGRYRSNLIFTGGHSVEKGRRIFEGGEAAITESFARKHGAKEGGKLWLSTPKGPAEFRIAGIYSDYSSDQGIILISRPSYDRFWRPAGSHSLAVFLKPGAQWKPLAAAFRESFGSRGEYSIYSNGELRSRIMAVFEQTFSITSLLRVIAVIVAVCGVYLSATVLVAERRREIAMLRACGASAGQIQGMLAIECGMLGLLSAILGLAAGGALALVLVFVVNPAFFGWTISLHLPLAALASIPLWMAAAAAIASWPASRAACAPPLAESLREE